MMLIKAAGHALYVCWKSFILSSASDEDYYHLTKTSRPT